VDICTVRKTDGAVTEIGGKPFIAGITPRAWLVIDDHGRESVYLDHALAIQHAAEHRGTVIGLVTQRIE
jgi:hypothetical protein